MLIILILEVIKVNSVKEEYDYIFQKVGKRGEVWELLRQELVFEDNVPYDILTVKIFSTGEKKAFKFDISSFF